MNAVLILLNEAIGVGVDPSSGVLGVADPLRGRGGTGLDSPSEVDGVLVSTPIGVVEVVIVPPPVLAPLSGPIGIKADSPSDPSAGVAGFVAILPPGSVCAGAFDVADATLSGADATSSGADVADSPFGAVAIGIDSPFGVWEVGGPLAVEAVTSTSVCIVSASAVVGIEPAIGVWEVEGPLVVEAVTSASICIVSASAVVGIDADAAFGGFDVTDPSAGVIGIAAISRSGTSSGADIADIWDN